MQIELLETFLDVAETRNFHRSAERLGVTQSTVSARIAALEAALGARLLIRSRAGTELTAEGSRFDAHARGLRHAWEEARRAVAAGGTGPAVRIGIQTDLATGNIGDWAQEFRRALPEHMFYLELDYSQQMGVDLDLGRLDLALVYTPARLPDLHFTTVGTSRYVMVSNIATRRDDLPAARLIRASYSVGFDRQQALLVPDMASAPVASGQEAAVTSLLAALGGAAFVLEKTARRMEGQGFRRVEDVEPIALPVLAGVHIRHRTSALHRRLLRIVREQFARREAEAAG